MGDAMGVVPDLAPNGDVMIGLTTFANSNAYNLMCSFSGDVPTR